MKQKLSFAAYLLFLVAFGVGTFRCRDAYRQLSESIRETADLRLSLAQNAALITSATQGISASTRQSDYLQSLVNILPQSKSFVRTQEAIAEDVELLRAKVGRRVKNDLHVVVDTQANKLYVKKGLTLLWEADCSVGKGGILSDKSTGRRWEFVTPKGQFEIRDKIENPLWIKPDWAFVEEKKPVPPPGDPSRMVPGELGAYVMNLGDGYLIHGTKDESVLGHSVSHGCVRLGAADLKRLYETAPRGTKVYIY